MLSASDLSLLFRNVIRQVCFFRIRVFFLAHAIQMESLLEPVSHVLSHATGLRAAKLGGTNHGHETGRSCTMPGTENTSMPKHHNDTIGDFLIPCRFCSHYSNSNSNTLVHNLNHNHVFRWTFHRHIFWGTGFIESMD